MKILLLDNHDSFTYNLAHLLKELISPKDNLDIVFSDRVNLSDGQNYDRLIFSPGPGLPHEAGILIPFIKHYLPLKPILGVCLGHQALAQSCGATLLNPKTVFHGLKSKIRLIQKTPLFDQLPGEIEVGRYHSWLVAKKNFPSVLKITAVDEKNRIMAISHKIYNAHGVQFHPESILTPFGGKLLKNFLKSGENHGSPKQ
jgi:anthranilate synthase component 2